MRNLAFLTAISAFFFIPAAQAGFEWMPPVSQPQPTAQYSEVPPVAPLPMAGEMMGGFPATPVTSEPLDQQYAPTPMPQQQLQQQQAYQQPADQPTQQQAYQPAPQPQGQNLSGQGNNNRTGGLYIDPYPLQNLQTRSQAVTLSEDSVQQAMVEESRMLNPLKLGAGMKTGVQPKPAMMPVAPAANDFNNVPRGPMGGGMTPMMGGEPAPLPGMARPADNFKAAMPPDIHYAEAVGFGRDLPLALALSQVIPAEFTHSFAADVDVGTTVSWEGGKPWNEVLQDMLRPHNLTTSIQGTNVTIQPMASL